METIQDYELIIDFSSLTTRDSELANTLRHRPDFLPECFFGPELATVLAHTPDGTSTDGDVRLACLCTQHAINEWPKPLDFLVILDNTDHGSFETRFGKVAYEDRDSFVDFLNQEMPQELHLNRNKRPAKFGQRILGSLFGR
jgi:hypothetical protein